jgi:ubiquinone/menaquinone biosynthesis C-methylase UbiE
MKILPRMTVKTKNEWNRILMNLKSEFVRNLNLQEGQSVLVLCCGLGEEVFLIREMVGETGQVVGIDIDKDLIAQAKNRIKDLGYTNVNFIVKDASDLGDYFGLFDRVCCLFGLHYFEYLEDTLYHWRKCLKYKKGILGIAYWMDSYPNEIIDGIRRITMSYIKGYKNYNDYNKRSKNNKKKRNTDIWNRVVQNNLEYSLHFENAINYWNLQKKNDFYKKVRKEIGELKFQEMNIKINLFLLSLQNPPLEERLKIKLVYAYN